MRSERLRCSGLTAGPSNVFSLMCPGWPSAPATTIRNDPDATLSLSLRPRGFCAAGRGIHPAMALRVLVLALAAALVAPAAAVASVTVATDAKRPALRVDASGYAEVSWSA